MFEDLLTNDIVSLEHPGPEFWLILKNLLTGNYQRDVSVNHGVFYAAVRAAIARGAGVSSTRVTSLLVSVNYK